MRWFSPPEPRCQHQWTKVAVTYCGGTHGMAPPMLDMNHTVAMILRFGLTTVLISCSVCGAVEQRELRGKPIDRALADLVAVPDPE